MTDIILILILFCILLLMCATCVLGGFFIGVRLRPKPIPKAPPEPMTEEQRRKIEKRRREEINFLNYDGSEQE